MTENPPSPTPATTSTGLFRTADGQNFLLPFILVTSLFLLWGFCNGMIDILNKHFQDSLNINKEQSGLVQFANYLAYFLMAVPAGLIARKFGYKGGILVGLVFIGAGAFWFVRATDIGAYWAFLLGLFIIALGMTCLETIANPYTTVLGPPESGATRINIAQTINGGGWILGPIVGGQFVSAAKEGADSNASLHIPYLGIGVFVTILLAVFIFSKIPDLRTRDESQKSGQQTVRIKPSAGQLAGIGVVLLLVWGVLYFFISPILGLVWTLLNLNQDLFLPTKYGLLIIAYIASFIVVAKNWDLFRRKHFTLGIATQFLYVAAQTGIFSFFVNYVLEVNPSVTKAQAATMLGAIGFVLFACGRLFGSAAISKLKPQLVLAAYAAVNVALCVVVMGGGKPGLFALYGTFFFMSVMFPTIFALGIRGLGDYTKLGSSLIVMSIVGGAIAAPYMGGIADRQTMRCGPVSADDIKGLPAIIDQWNGQSNAVSAFVWQSLSEQDHSVLAGYQHSAANSNQAQGVIVQSLNKIIIGPSIYETNRFKDIPLRSETANLLQQNLSGTNAAPLNRLLLEDAYPLELSRIQSMRAGFAVPLVCFVFIALYGLFWKKLEDKDAVA
jgi:FHS family L-fucose permease-like MFS transporter